MWPTYAVKLSMVPRRRTDSRYSGKVSKSHAMPAASVAGIHVLDVLERAHDHVVVLGAGRRDREAAVAGDDGGDAVVRRRPERGVPEHLRVVVRVDVDEAGRHRASRRVELALAARGSARSPRSRRRRPRRRRARPGAPVPSTTVPPRMTTSAGISMLLSVIDHELQQVLIRVADVHARCGRSTSTLALHGPLDDVDADIIEQRVKRLGRPLPHEAQIAARRSRRWSTEGEPLALPRLGPVEVDHLVADVDRHHVRVLRHLEAQRAVERDHVVGVLHRKRHVVEAADLAHPVRRHRQSRRAGRSSSR